MIGQEEQRSDEWYKVRLGNFTGSEVGKLMNKGRKKDELFGETAKSYIYQVAAERDMIADVINDDELFELYRKQTEAKSKAMDWGIEKEPEARELFATKYNMEMIEVGSCVHPTIPHFASSPDGMCWPSENEKYAIEIKCPNQATFMRYATEIVDGDSLKSVKPEYYWQCQSHMVCTGASKCYFIAYCPWQNKPLHVVEILPNEADVKELESRVIAANEMVSEIINK